MREARGAPNLRLRDTPEAAVRTPLVDRLLYRFVGDGRDSRQYKGVPLGVRVRMYIADQTWPELGEYFADESLALVPLGSTEQHGPHLPLATDHLIAEGLAREAADRTGFLCTPTVNVGVSPHHRQFHGTMWVDAPQFRDYVESFTRNLTYHGIDRVVYVNAHGGNVEHLREVGRRLRDEEELYAVEWMWDESIPELVDDLFEYNGPHGGPKETAMIQHLRPDLVRPDRLADARDGGLRDWETELPDRYGAQTFYDAIDNTENGVLGDQTDATAEKGERLFEAATEQLCQLCTWLDEQPFEALMPKPHV
jgi:creatinine amidohydrolase